MTLAVSAFSAALASLASCFLDCLVDNTGKAADEDDEGIGGIGMIAGSGSGVVSSGLGVGGSSDTARLSGEGYNGVEASGKGSMGLSIRDDMVPSGEVEARSPCAFAGGEEEGDVIGGAERFEVVVLAEEVLGYGLLL
jgi:hypothetical protein